MVWLLFVSLITYSHFGWVPVAHEFKSYTECNAAARILIEHTPSQGLDMQAICIRVTK